MCKARAEAKFTWIMPSRRQRCIYMNDFVKPKDQREFIRFGLARIFVQASAIERLLILPSAAENVKRKSHFYEGFAGRFCIIAKVHYYENTAKTFCRIFVQAITPRALRIFFSETPSTIHWLA